MTSAHQRDLQDHKALVTGATSGLGPAIALRLAGDGAEVVVHGRNAARGAETVDALFVSNVRAPYFLVAAVAPAMAARGSGSIISISSMVGQVGLPTGAAYGATKGALESMTRAWAAEFSPSGVRVNAIAPGPVYTEGALRERTEAIGTTTPLNRAADADEIAGVVAFLASPQASYMTGAIVAADGGRTAI